jgi:hypothetical protein
MVERRDDAIEHVAEFRSDAFDVTERLGHIEASPYLGRRAERGVKPGPDVSAL